MNGDIRDFIRFIKQQSIFPNNCTFHRPFAITIKEVILSVKFYHNIQNFLQLLLQSISGIIIVQIWSI